MNKSLRSVADFLFIGLRLFNSLINFKIIIGNLLFIIQIFRASVDIQDQIIQKQISPVLWVCLHSENLYITLCPDIQVQAISQSLAAHEITGCRKVRAFQEFWIAS